MKTRFEPSTTCYILLRLMAIAWLVMLFSDAGLAADWLRFRGPNGSGISTDGSHLPSKWTDHLRWEVDLPGPGLSSPIVVGDRIFVTCWTGYGADPNNDDPKSLKRHLVCLGRADGNTLWSRAIDPYLPEDEFGGMFAENGYASHSPVSDGERVYVFFGKTGVLAFSLEGEQLWAKGLGTESDPRGWGSASSPIVYKNLLIVTASAESEALVALDKATGEEVWRKEAAGFSGTWATPALVNVDDNRTELVLAVPYEIWSFNPETGKLLWYCDGPPSNSVCASLLVDGTTVYAVGRREGGSVAVRAGGQGDVSETHLIWSQNHRAGIGTPLLQDKRIYWVSSGVAKCISAATGEEVFTERIRQADRRGQTDDNPVADRSRRRRRGSGRGQDYSSPVAADGKLYFVSRRGAVSTLGLSGEYELLGTDQLGEGDEQFSATPAISNGQVFVRSNRRLYCIAQ